MKIALVMEWSTCTKNEIVYETLDSLIWMTIVRHTTRMPF